MSEAGYTVWFETDPRSIKGNPFFFDTPFGTATTIGVGNIFAERDSLAEALERLADAARSSCNAAAHTPLIEALAEADALLAK